MSNVIKGKVTPIKENVLITDMHFGEQKTNSGLIIADDDGKTRGIYPRWGKVYKKGDDNTDPYKEGQWILIEHGRWTRAFTVDDGDGEKEIRLIDRKSVLLYSDKKPEYLSIGKEFDDGPVNIDPQSFNTLDQEGSW